MQNEQIEKFLLILKQYRLPLALALAGLIFFIYGLISFFGSASKTNEIKFVNDNQAVAKPQNLISIDIEGQVVNPGVYRLNQDSIIKDALILAGGLASDADRDFVAKNINLAAKLSDGAKIYIPKIGESVSQVRSAATSVSDLININQALAESLDSLPGIGAVTAQKIINNRPYATINELLDKKIVSAKVFTQIKDRITAY
nr:ComEA family DNA-binding protein [Candidatus Levybacteria bacterium]